MTPQQLSDITAYSHMRTAELFRSAAAHRRSRDAAVSVAPGSAWRDRARFRIRGIRLHDPATAAAECPDCPPAPTAA